MDESSSSDLSTKYQKLATEYSKIRAQMVVLKKAVSEEQSKSTELKDVLKEKDQVIRKLEQEVECLNFRNLQLTKRVSVLQDDLEAINEKSKKVKNKSEKSSAPSAAVPQEAQSILNAELLSRIEENEKLHQKVFAAETEHKQAIEELTSKLESLESEKSKQIFSLNEVIKRHESTIAKLTQERAKFEVTLKNLEKELTDERSQKEMYQVEGESVQNDLGAKLKQVNKLLQENAPFIDSRYKLQNSLNVPVLLRSKQNNMILVVKDLGVLIAELVRRLSDLHTYMEQRIQLSDPDIQQIGPLKRYGCYLHENAQYLKAVELAYDELSTKIQKDMSYWLEGLNIMNILVAFSKYVRYLEKLLPYLLLSIQAENRVKGSIARLDEIHHKLQSNAVCLTSGFSKLERYLLLLAETSSTDNNFVGQAVIAKKLLQALIFIRNSFEEAKKCFSAKVLLEHQLPTVTDKIKATDDCLLSSLVSVVTTVNKICILVEDKLHLLVCDIPFRPRGFISKQRIQVNPVVPSFRDRGMKYITTIQLNQPQSVPYSIALKNNEILQNCADSKDNLVQELTLCKNKLTKLEQDKEYWMLECQLLQAKYAKGKNSSILQEDMSAEDGQQFQMFLKSSINNLVTQVQQADSKASTFHSECLILHQRLQLAEQRRTTSVQDLDESKKVIERLQEELQTTVKSYEDQLSMMSEHLANMNDKLTSQKDEIDALRHAGNNKGKRKGK